MKRYYVYILLCSDKKYYTGVTNNIEERFLQHQRGDDPTCFTFRRRPLKLVFQQDFSEISQAISAEKQIKGWSKKKKQALINNDAALLHELAECKNESHSRNMQRDVPSFVSAQDDTTA